MSEAQSVSEPCVSQSLEACMRCYCNGRNLCAAATVVEHLVGQLQDAEDDEQACMHLSLFRKWSYIMGCHYRSDRFGLCDRQPAPPPVSKGSAQIIEFRPRVKTR